VLAAKVQHAQFPEHIVTGESARAAPLHVVPSNESNAVVDVMVDGPIRAGPE
jgi:hypothetical protein